MLQARNTVMEKKLERVARVVYSESESKVHGLMTGLDLEGKKRIRLPKQVRLLGNGKKCVMEDDFRPSKKMREGEPRSVRFYERLEAKKWKKCELFVRINKGVMW